jgi:hypothetical protein
MLGTGAMITRKRMAADEPGPAASRRQRRVHLRHDFSFGASGVGNETIGRHGGRSLNDPLGNHVDRRCHDEKLRFCHAASQIRHSVIDGPDLAGRVEARLSSADADDSARELPFPQSQTY